MAKDKFFEVLRWSAGKFFTHPPLEKTLRSGALRISKASLTAEAFEAPKLPKFQTAIIPLASKPLHIPSVLAVREIPKKSDASLGLETKQAIDVISPEDLVLIHTSPPINILTRFFNALRDTASNELFRDRINRNTMEVLSSPEKVERIQKAGMRNIQNWSRESSASASAGEVQVVAEDWGQTLLKATRERGIYGVINLANHKYPGGGFLREAEGSSAWEENLCARTTVPASILSKKGTEIYYDNVEGYTYTEEMRDRISAEIPMSPENLKKLSEACGKEIHSAHEVYWNNKVQFYWRDGAVTFDMSSVTTGDQIGASNRVTQQAYSFKPLHEDKICPFYEFRSAAPEMRNTEDWSDLEFIKQYEADIRRHIKAQLHTAIVNGQKRLILGAWGCGAFHNNPTIVAQIYREEIEANANFFEDIRFAIKPMRTEDEKVFEIFSTKLQGLKLGKEIAIDGVTTASTNKIGFS